MELYETLSDSEKASSIRSKIKTLQYQRYNIELDILIESAVAEPNVAYLAELGAQVEIIDLKQTALTEALDALPDDSQ